MANSNNKKQKGAIHTSLATPAPARGNGAVRIVSGQWRRSLIQVALADGLRPTSERVRETVFDWLAHLFESIDGLEVLDMFAGSGAMGFEAASRGASRVDWVDVNKAGILSIRAALKKLGGREGHRAHVGDAFRFVDSVDAPYDLIVIDPPFKADWQQKAVLAAKRVLKPEGLLYVESPKALLDDDFVAEARLVRVRSGRAGAVSFELLAHEGSGMAGLAKLSKEEKRKKK